MAFSIQELTVRLPMLGERTIGTVRKHDAPRPSNVTILIGRNGSGKSTILRDVIQILRPLGQLGRARAAAFSVLRLAMRRGERAAIVEGGEVAERSEANVMPEAGNALPEKLIALSFTPFDKFPVRDDLSDEEDTRSPFYVYLGFKTENGRSSVASRLLRTLDRLAFREHSERADNGVATMLADIGYAPRIELSFSLSPRVRDHLRKGISPSPAASRQMAELEATGIMGLFRPRRFDETIDMLIDFETGEQELVLTRRAQVRRTRIVEPEERIPLSGSLDGKMLARLVEIGALKTASAIVTVQATGDMVDLLELSSGELSIISGFLGLAVHLSDDCLVLIDEPENSLHPAWQIKYVQMLDAAMKRFKGAHYFIATHSPLIVSGAASFDPVILRLDLDPVTVDAGILADESPDATLVKAFDVVTHKNNFLRHLVLEGLTLIETEQADTLRARQIASLFNDLLPRIDHGDPVRDVIKAYVERVADNVS